MDDYRTILAVEVRDLAKRCGIRRKDVAHRLGLKTVRNLNYWCKGEKDGKPFLPSPEHIEALSEIRRRLVIVDEQMIWFGRKAYLQKML